MLRTSFLSIIFIAAVVTASSTRASLQKHIKVAPIARDLPPLYLPDAPYIKLVTLGFDNFASDLLWFRTVNYFGKQYRSKKDYRWLTHMCELVTALDPKKRDQYIFCANMIAWEVKDFEKSIELLTQALNYYPNDWYLLYLRGFNYWYFVNNREKAQEDLVRASKHGAPPFVASIASRLLVEEKAAAVAIDFLESLIRQTADETARNALIEKLHAAYLRRDLDMLNRAVKLYTQKHGSPPRNLSDLVRGRILKKLPVEPFGGRYVFDIESGQVGSTSGKKPLQFFGRTKETGIFGMEQNE